MYRLILSALVLGLLATVTVAWSCVYFLPVGDGAVRSSPSPSQELTRLAEKAPVGFSFDKTAGIVVVHDQGIGADMLTFAFMRTSADVVDDEARLVWGGWPLRCFAGDVWVNFPPRQFVQRNSLLYVPRLGPSGFKGSVLLPFRPLWIAFTLNWVFYFVGILSGLLLLRMMKRIS